MLKDLEDLEEILDEADYNNLNSQDYKEDVIAYIKTYEIQELENESQISFMKKLTKILSLILKDEPESLDGLLEQIYDYHQMGIDTIDSKNLKKVGIYKQDFWDCKNYINLFECCTKNCKDCGRC